MEKQLPGTVPAAPDTKETSCARRQPEQTALHEGSPCPECGRPLLLHHSSRGDFLGCSNFPLCRFICNVYAKSQVAVLQEVGAPCPRCGKALQVKKGRFGIFIGCAGYPECGYIYSSSADTGITCPVCRKGTLVRRQGRSGRSFYACSAFPSCTFSVNGEPAVRTCRICGFPLCFKKQVKAGTALVCANSLCSSRRSRKYDLIND